MMMKWKTWWWVVLGLVSTTAWANKSPYDWTFVRLDYARQEKVDQLRNFCDRIHALALKASEDSLVINCFDINAQYAEALKQSAVPEALTAKVMELRQAFNNYYIENYFSFYDMLFVNRQGKVFYSLRKEADQNENFLQGDPSRNALVQCLSQLPENEAFVDFHNYGPSQEPAAFFVEPIHKDGVPAGWLILQCAVNKVNSLLAWTDDLGQTGETFLVNREGFMLTESNFTGSSTILKMRLDNRNVQAKFAQKSGHHVVTDYRGCTALTSFEVVDFMGAKWLVVAKVDKDEVTTQHYAQHRRYYADKLLARLKESTLPPLREPYPPAVRVIHRVDMDEFLRAEKGDLLQTFGVATCTGLLVASPGKFAYLAHISPRDKIYGADGTNLVGQMIKKVQTFDIYPSEHRHIAFVAVVNHLESLLRMVDKLVEEGFLLSQIRVLYNPRAESSAISYDYLDDQLSVSWRLAGQTGRPQVHQRGDAVDVGKMIEEIMGWEQESLPQEISFRNDNTGTRIN